MKRAKHFGHIHIQTKEKQCMTYGSMQDTTLWAAAENDEHFNSNLSHTYTDWFWVWQSS